MYLDLGYDYAYEFISKTMAEYVSGAETAGERDWKSDLWKKSKVNLRLWLNLK